MWSPHVVSIHASENPYLAGSAVGPVSIWLPEDVPWLHFPQTLHLKVTGFVALVLHRYYVRPSGTISSDEHLAEMLIPKDHSRTQ